MTTNTIPSAPSFMFKYILQTIIAAPAVVESSFPNLYDRTSTFLSSFTKAITPTQQFPVQQQRVAVLEQVKAGIECHMSAKQKAGGHLQQRERGYVEG